MFYHYCCWIRGGIVGADDQVLGIVGAGHGEGGVHGVAGGGEGGGLGEGAVGFEIFFAAAGEGLMR